MNSIQDEVKQEDSKGSEDQKVTNDVPLEREPQRYYQQKSKPQNVTDPKAGIHVSGQRPQIANKIKNQEIMKKVIFYEKSFSKKKLFLDNLSPISLEKLESVRETIVYPDDQFAKHFKILDSQRIILLMGQSEVGKFYLSQYLTWLLVKKYQDIKSVLLATSLAEDLQIDLRKSILSNKKFKNLVLIFKDAFDKGNPDILHFFEDLVEADTIEIINKLRENEVFLIFTSDDSAIENYKYIFSKLRVRERIDPPDSIRLEKALELQIKKTVYLENGNLNERVECILENRSDIVKRLGSLRNINSFVELYSEEIKEGKKTIDEAIELILDIEKQIEYWFLRDIGCTMPDYMSLEEWCFVVSLTFANEVSWTRFDKLFTDITKIVNEEFNPVDSDGKIKRTLWQDPLIKKCKAQITKDITSGDDIIKFSDSRYPEVLFEVMLKHNRGVALRIAQYFRELAKDRDDENKILAARNLGRFGAFDITRQYIRTCLESEDDTQIATLGYLYEGISQSRNHSYIENTSNYLKQLAMSSDFNEQLAAIVIYTHLGQNDPSFAMKEFKRIIREIKSKKSLDIESIFFKEYLSIQDLFEGLKVALEAGVLLSAIQNSVVALCILKDPVQLLSELLEWINDEEKVFGVIVVLFFLNENGIADGMCNGKNALWVNENNDDKNDKITDLMRKVAIDRESENYVINFLRDIFYSINIIPFRSQAPLRDTFFHFLKEFTIIALKQHEARNGIKATLVGLYIYGGEKLRRALWNYLRKWESKKVGDSQVDQFVDEVLQEIIFQ